MKQHKDFKVISVNDIVDDEVTNTIEVNLVDYPLVGTLHNLRSDVIKEKDEVVNLARSVGSYNRNPCESNTFTIIVVDNVLPWQMESSKSMDKKFICAIG